MFPGCTCEECIGRWIGDIATYAARREGTALAVKKRVGRAGIGICGGRRRRAKRGGCTRWAKWSIYEWSSLRCH